MVRIVRDRTNIEDLTPKARATEHTHRVSMKARPFVGTRGREAADLASRKNLWHPEQNSNGFVSLGVAENALMHEQLLPYIHKNFSMLVKGLTYGDGATGSKELQHVLARFVTRKLSPAQVIEPSHVTITNDVSTVTEQLSNILADPGMHSCWVSHAMVHLSTTWRYGLVSSVCGCPSTMLIRYPWILLPHTKQRSRNATPKVSA